ncbi:MAG TPA: glycosyltransferase [Solirubrobacteraceae bacterium]|nr:glycosyltransferase [Solirubrobacteraceae bacterium]
MPETVAYVLKGWPRISELFIASEIYRLEQAGLNLRLYVIKPPDESETHTIVDRIAAQPEYLPPTTSLSSTTLVRWLRQNLRPFLPALRRTAGRHPAGLARAAGMALAQSIRARKGFWPRKLYAKELLQAVALADRLAAAPDVRHLHAHFAHGTTTVTWLASAITGLPFSFTGHAKDIYAPSLNPAGLLARKLRAARFAVTCTEANVRHLEAIAPEATVHRVYHGLNADFSRLMGEEHAPAPGPNGTLRLLGVGRLVAKKGFDTVVDACRLLQERGVPFEAVIVGPDDDAGPALHARIGELGLEGHIRLEGQMSQAELLEEYRRASAFCLPCRVLDNGDRDGIPNVLAEAMACGAPVVTTAISGIPEIVRDGVNGLLVAPDDPAGLADAVLRLRENRALAQRISEEAAATVRRELDGERLAVRLQSLFREAIA